jgi:phospho-N-acetylmuramoyl-pentapeptide-transferase
VIALAIAVLTTSLLGFYDDYLTLARGRKSGQKWSHKLAGQFVIAAGLVVYLWAEHGPALSLILVPGMRNALNLGVWWLPVAAIYLCLMSNAANLSDGLDGLAAGLCLIAAGITAAVAMAGAEPGIAVFCLALGGACLGFLWFNCHPARIFMGNTSSIALGMALGGAALVTRQEILLLVPFGVFMAEAFSVVAQVGYYKLTHRRIFLKAPIHHHFEMLGWKETSVVVRFWIVAILLAFGGAVLLTL